MPSDDLAVFEKQLFAHKSMFDQALPRSGLTAERMMRTVVISCERNPRLLECTPSSILQSAMTGAILGLEADGHTGQGFLIPFSVKRVMTCQWVTGYKGLATLGWRAGLTIAGNVVREGDVFEFEDGTNPFVRHKAVLGGGDRRIVAAWASATAPNRTPLVCVMSYDEILEIRDRSPGAKDRNTGQLKPDSPWNIPGIPHAAMVMKTPRRRLSRWLPLSDFVLAARIDEAHEEQGKHSYLDPDKGIVIDGVARPLNEGAAPSETGPAAAQLDAPGFAIKGVRGEWKCNTIEEWRARMLDTIAGLRKIESVERFKDLNDVYLDDYCHKHPGETRDVADAFERRKRQIPGIDDGRSNVDRAESQL